MKLEKLPSLDPIAEVRVVDRRQTPVASRCPEMCVGTLPGIGSSKRKRQWKKGENTYPKNAVKGDKNVDRIIFFISISKLGNFGLKRNYSFCI